MSNNPAPKSLPISPTVLLLCCTTVFVFAVVAAVAVFIAAPEGANTGSLIAIILSSVPVTIASLLSVSKLFQVSEAVTEVRADTDKLTNGFGQRKMEDAVLSMVHPDFLTPEARERLAPK